MPWHDNNDVEAAINAAYEQGQAEAEEAAGDAAYEAELAGWLEANPDVDPERIHSYVFSPTATSERDSNAYYATEPHLTELATGLTDEEMAALKAEREAAALTSAGPRGWNGDPGLQGQWDHEQNIATSRGQGALNQAIERIVYGR